MSTTTSSVHSSNSSGVVSMPPSPLSPSSLSGSTSSSNYLGTSTTSLLGTSTRNGSGGAPPPPLVDYILVAEFDIDKGSTIAFQYPESTGEETQMLAELMLPDGVHKLQEDWTVFFLRRPTLSQIVPEAANKLKKSKSSSIDAPMQVYIYEYSEQNQNQGWNPLGSDKKLISLTPTGIKVHSRDGEVVTTIEKHANLDYTQLEPSFTCVLTESGTALGLRFVSLEQEALFIQHIESLIQQIEEEKKAPVKEVEQTQESKAAAEVQKPFLYCLNLCLNQKDSSVRRGAVVKAMALCTRHQYIHIFKPVIVLALQKFYTSRTEDVLSELYNILNSLDLTGLEQYTDHRKQILRTSNDKSKQAFVTGVKYLTMRMNFQIPLTLFPDEVGDYKVITLIKKFGNQVLAIYNGLLTEKRILFLGFDCSAGEVCEYVLATICMVCPPLKGFTKRAYPYTNLTYLDFLSVPGYIAGVTNPMFEQHTEWWDILCNINTGKVTLAPQIIQQQALIPEQQRDKHAVLDNEFMNNVNTNIGSHYGEDTVRSLFQNYTQHIVDMAFDEEEFADEHTRQQELECNRLRIDIWKRTISYKIYESDKKAKREASSIKDANIPRWIKKLRICKNVTELEMISIYQSFLDNIRTEEQILEFLSYLPELSGGLLPVAVSLLHVSETVRISTAKLLKRLDKSQAGAPFIKGLNYFLVCAYERVCKSIKEFD